MEYIPSPNKYIYQENNNLYNIQEYYLIKENIVYKFLIEKNDKNIITKCENYIISFNHNDLSFLTKIKWNILLIQIIFKKQ